MTRAHTDRRVLVTGARGFIGRHLVAALAQAGWAVTGVDSAPHSGGEPDGLLTADLADPAVLQDVRRGRYAAVVHQAAISSTLEQDWTLLRRVNVDSALALAQAAAEGGARFVYASSNSVYGRIHAPVWVAEDDVYNGVICSGPLNKYARSKLLLDEGMRQLGERAPDWVALRYTNIFGEGESGKGSMMCILTQLVRAAARGEPLTLFADTLDAARDYLPVGAVADVVRRLVEAPEPIPSGIYNLGSGEAVTFATVLRWCVEFGGAPVEVSLQPNPIADRYQYWTCADNSRLYTQLPGCPRIGVADVRAEANRLYTQFRRVASVARAANGT
jgi:ADP-L-glycero-D-manno-heptose 6-epimerase